MYRCKACERTTEPGQQRLTVRVHRPVEYRVLQPKKTPRGKLKGWEVRCRRSGTEIHKEFEVCEACFESEENTETDWVDESIPVKKVIHKGPKPRYKHWKRRNRRRRR